MINLIYVSLVCAIALSVIPALPGSSFAVDSPMQVFRDALLGQNIHIADTNKLSDILEQLVLHGVGKLQLVVDFDRTLTNRWDVKRRRLHPTTRGILNQLCPLSLRNRIVLINKNIRAAETDLSLSRLRRMPLMVARQQSIQRILLKCTLKRDDIQDIVRRNANLRAGTSELLDWSGRLGVPLVVMSSGIGDVVHAELALAHAKSLPRTVKVVSNFCVFNSSNNLVGFSQPLIVSSGKSSTLIPASVAAELLGRSCMILVGDALDDATMSDGAELTTLLKIGLLNHNVDALLPRYLELFDIIVTGDASLEPLLAILHGVQFSTRPALPFR